ncbi:MAG TPA: DUF1674 domain-containing protein [Allosphingosinicella sp.]
MWGQNAPCSIGASMGQRPPHLKPPQHWTKSAPAPQPEPLAEEQAKETGGPKGQEPTRYGDWENKGICRDF